MVWQTKCFAVLVILQAIYNAVARETCATFGNTYAYCEEGYHCCHDNTRCCSDSLPIIVIIGIVIGAIVFLSCCIGGVVAVYKVYVKDSKKVADHPAPISVIHY